MKNSGVSAKPPALESGSKVPQRKEQRSDDAVDEEERKGEDDDDGFGGEETEEKSSSEEIYPRYSSQKCTKKQPRMEKNQSHQYQDGGQESKMQGKSPNTPKGPGAVENITVEM